MRLMVVLVCDDVAISDMPQGTADAGRVRLDSMDVPEDDADLAAEVARVIAETCQEYRGRVPFCELEDGREVFFGC